MRATVSLTMIVRDEETNLAACLSSVADLVDEIIVVDTGSVDRTKEIARGFGAKVFDFTWVDDFSAARNEARRHASSDWIFWMDADDRIDDANRVRLAQLIQNLSQHPANGCIKFMMNCQWSAAQKRVTFSHCRLFPNRAAMQWKGRIHEYVCTTNPNAPCDTCYTDIAIEHVGYSNLATVFRKQRRDLQLLQLEHLIDPDNPSVLFYLGRVYLVMGNYVDAERFLRRSLTRDNIANYSWTANAFRILAQSLFSLGRVPEGLAALQRGLSLFPTDPDLLFDSGCALIDNGRYGEAEAQFQQLLALPPRKYIVWNDEGGLRADRCYRMLGVICQRTARLQQAETYYRQALAKNPYFVDVLFNLGWLQISRGHFEEIPIIVRRLNECPEVRNPARLLQALSCYLKGDRKQARMLVEQFLGESPDVSLGWNLLGDILFDLPNERQTCISAYRRVLELDPSQDAVRNRLQQLLRQAESEKVCDVDDLPYDRESELVAISN